MQECSLHIEVVHRELFGDWNIQYDSDKRKGSKWSIYFTVERTVILQIDSDYYACLIVWHIAIGVSFDARNHTKR